MTLPSDPPSDEVEALRAALAAEQAARREAEARASGAEAMVAHLKLMIAKLRHDRFGASSERSRKLLDQLELELDELVTAAAEADASAVIAAGRLRAEGPATRRAPARGPLPDHLPRERVVVPAPAACPCCGGTLSKLGEDVTETLEVVPRRWKVIQTVRERFACRSCERVTQPPAPFHPIARGRAGPNLLAGVLEAKFGQHLPLNRQSETFAREGIDLSVSTLADWVGAASATLAPLVALVEAHVLSAARLHGDDTTVPLMARGRTVTARLWTYVRDDRPFGGPDPPAALFRFSVDRGGEHPVRHLAGYTGILQADAYAGFGELYAAGRRPGPIVEAACWAHLWMPPLLQVCSSRRRQKPQLRSSIRPVAATRPASPALMVIREPGPNHVPRAQGSMRPTGLPRPRSARFCHHARFTLATAPPRSPRPVSRPQAARGAGTP
jgi:transposase